MELPSSLVLGDLSRGPFAGSLPWTPNVCTVVVAARQGPVRHVEPTALAVLGVWAAHLWSEGTTIVIDPSLQTPYTWRVGLLGALKGRLDGNGAMNNMLSPLAVPDRVSINASLDSAVASLGLTKRGNVAAISHVYSEALRNVFEHSRSANGAVICGSHFPSQSRVTLAIVDRGVGVPQTIRRVYGDSLTDIQASRLAADVKISGAGTAGRDYRDRGASNNAGLGLFVMRTIASRTNGLFSLLSGRSCVEGSDTAEDMDTFEPDSPWAGTIVTVSFDPRRADRAMTATHEALTAGMTSNRKQQLVGWGRPPGDPVTIVFTSTRAGVFENKDDAIAQRDAVILPSIERGNPVCIDLSAGTLTTHSFVHALLFSAIQSSIPRSTQLLHVISKNKQIKDAVRLVGHYAREARIVADDG